MNKSKAVLTIATGKPVFLEMALNLARSFFWWHPGTDIEFHLVTDQGVQLPPDLQGRLVLVNIRPGEFGLSFSSKLFLDEFVRADRTLFIDSDCLVFGKLERVFDAFEGRAVSVVGGYIREGDWFGDVSAVCRRFGIQQMPKFNGGLYYLEKGEAARSVYRTARELEKQYDAIGFKRLRGSANDEVLMAVSLQLNGQIPVPDDGTILGDPQACPGPYLLDVIGGARSLHNPPAPHPLHQNWYPFEQVSPLIVHFLGYHTCYYPYRREAGRLKMALSDQLNTLAEIKLLVQIEYPARITNAVKNALRPVYRFFGATGR